MPEKNEQSKISPKDMLTHAEQERILKEKALEAELRAIIDEVRAASNTDDRHLINVEFTRKFREKNPDYAKYVLYHILGGSSPVPGQKLEFDTEDHQIEDSIRKLKKSSQ